MNKNKVLGISVVALILLNVGILLFFTLTKPPHPPLMHGGPREGGPKDRIIRELGFDKDQKEKFENLILEHHTSIQKAESKMREGRKHLFQSLKDGNTSIKDSLLNVISLNQREIESIHYDHFLDIKALCKDDQLNNFEHLVDELFKPRPPRP